MLKLTQLPPELIIKIIGYHVEGLGVSLLGNKLLIIDSIQSALIWERICKTISNESLIRNYLTDNFWIKIILENFVRETLGVDSSLKSTPRRKINEHVKSKQDVKTLLVNYREFLKLITDFPHSMSIYQRYFIRKDVLETFQIVVLGHHQAGKSQLVNSFLRTEKDHFSHNNEIYTRVEKHPITPNQIFRMQIMDTHSLHSCYQHIYQAHAILLICSHCQLEETLYETEQILKRCIDIKQSSSFPLIVALNKSDESRTKCLKKLQSKETSPSTPKSPTTPNCCQPSSLNWDPSSSPSSWNSPPPLSCFSAPLMTGTSLTNTFHNNINNSLINITTSNISSYSFNGGGTPLSLTLSSNCSPSLINNTKTSSTHNHQMVRTEEDEYKIIENLLIRYGMNNYRVMRTSGKTKSNIAEVFDECVLRGSLNHAKLISDVIDAAVVHHVEATEKFFHHHNSKKQRCNLF